MATKPLTDEQKRDAARLRALFEQRQAENPKLTQESLAFACNWKTQGAVSQYLLGRIPLNLRAMLKFAKELQVPPDLISPDLAKQIRAATPGASMEYARIAAPVNLAMENSTSYDSNLIMAAPDVRAIPVISAIQAGKLTEIADVYPPGAGFDTEYVGSDVSPRAFALEIKGTSMLPRFRTGDRVIIDPDIAPNPGDFVVAKNSDEEATFKTFKLRGIDERGNNLFELVPLNDEYPILRSDVHHLKIIGVMVEHRRKYRRNNG